MFEKWTARNIVFEDERLKKEWESPRRGKKRQGRGQMLIRP